jgi:hypothetical protein
VLGIILAFTLMTTSHIICTAAFPLLNVIVEAVELIRGGLVPVRELKARLCDV